MISVEKARRLVKLHNTKVAEIKWKQAEEFINKVIEPAIIEASVHGKCKVTVDIGECAEASSEVVCMIRGAGFRAERSRNNAAVYISWDANGGATPYNARAIMVIRE